MGFPSDNFLDPNQRSCVIMPLGISGEFEVFMARNSFEIWKFDKFREGRRKHSGQLPMLGLKSPNYAFAAEKLLVTLIGQNSKWRIALKWIFGN